MEFWDVLGIEPTDKISDIKKAYAKNLRLHHPEDDPEGFQKLREAYTAAINYAKVGQHNGTQNGINDSNDFEDNIESNIEESKKISAKNLKDDSDENVKNTKLHDVNFKNGHEQDEVDGRRINIHNFKDDKDLSPNEDNFQNSVDKFISNVEKLYDDFYSRIDIEKWKEVLNSEAIWYIGDKEYLNNKFIEFLKKRFYLPRDVWKLIDSTFGFTNNKEYFYERYSKEDVDEILLLIDMPIDFSFKYFENIENIDIDKYFTLRKQGYYAFMRGDLSEAKEKLFKAYDIYKNDPSLIKIIAEYYFAVKDFDNALKYTYDILNITSGDEDAVFLKAKILYEKKDIKIALDIFKKLYEKYPEADEVLSFLGRCYFQLNDTENCEKVFLKIIKKNPLDIQAKAILMGIAYKKKKELKGRRKKSGLIKLCKEAGISQSLVNKRVKPNVKVLLFAFVFLVFCALASLSSMMKDANMTISKENIVNFIEGKRTPVVINNYNELTKVKSGENIVKLKLKDIQEIDACKVDRKYGDKVKTTYGTGEELDDKDLWQYVGEGYNFTYVGKLGDKYIIFMEDADHGPDNGKAASMSYTGTVYKNESSEFKKCISKALKDDDIKDKYQNKKINIDVYVSEEAKLEEPNNFKSLVFGISIILGFFVLIVAILEQLNIKISFKGEKHEYTR